MRDNRVRAMGLGLGLAMMAGPALAGDAVKGEAAYKMRCTGCHAVDANKVGPMHRGVVGRAAGSVPGYAYSKPLKASGIVWSEALIAQWISGPQAMVPGAFMRFTVADPAERADIAAYLATLK